MAIMEEVSATVPEGDCIRRLAAENLLWGEERTANIFVMIEHGSRRLVLPAVAAASRLPKGEASRSYARRVGETSR
jgi:hypothetical protein